MPKLRGSRSSQSGVTPAQVAELVDALASGASGGNSVEVRVLSWAPHAVSGSLTSSLDSLKPRIIAGFFVRVCFAVSCDISWKLVLLSMLGAYVLKKVS